ncbi:phage holin family protein [Actinokineospora sp. G85]|uniref:phage holin family protein n=1 Tax=Actinokineospora sp. G85 TaxID=3406626 RepID=UPI003C72B2AC
MTDPRIPVDPHAQGAVRAEPEREPSLGELVGEITSDLTRLLRQEIELAKAEVTAEAKKAGKAAGMLGGAGFAGYMVAVLASLALAFGLANVMDLGWATALVALLWAIAGAVLFATGRKAMRSVSPKPEKTIETLKEDVAWARHPTS